MKITVKTIVFGTMITALGLSFTACTAKQESVVAPAPKEQIKQAPPPVKVVSDEEKHAQYKESMKKIGTEIKKDASYKKLDLSTPELKEWFSDITYRLWDYQMTQEQFIAAGLAKFPDRRYEFEKISYGLLAR